ncbi:spatacsin-like [Artemia franciscana]|uniref:Spatacsin C-terminal domain-containing protein n=1 Tax=Artemia franciscana TaxID=6661 RepID=A0AA88HRH9_ARTSF|nr:hypothetical protein QYM36_011875 [Artemia franciscana]
MSFSHDLQLFFDNKYHAIYTDVNNQKPANPEFLNSTVNSFGWHPSKNILCIVDNNGITYFDASVIPVGISETYPHIPFSALQSLFSPYLLGFDSPKDMRIIEVFGNGFICRCRESQIFSVRNDKDVPLEIAWNLQVTAKSLLYKTDKFLFFFVPESKTLNVCNLITGSIEHYIEFDKELKKETVFLYLSVCCDDSLLALAGKDSVFVMYQPLKSRKSMKFDRIIQKKSFLVESLRPHERLLTVLFNSEVLSARLYRIYDVDRNLLLYETQIDKLSIVVYPGLSDYPDVIYKKESFRVLGVTGEKEGFVLDRILNLSENEGIKCIDFLRKWSPQPLPVAFLKKAIKSEKFVFLKKFLDLRYALEEFCRFVQTEDDSRLNQEKLHISELLEVLHDSIRVNFENFNKQAFNASLANSSLESVSQALDKIIYLHQELSIPRHLVSPFTKLQCDFISILLDFSFDIEVLAQKSQEYLAKISRRRGSTSQSSTRSQTPELYLGQQRIEKWRTLTANDIIDDVLISDLIALGAVFLKKEREVILTFDGFKDYGLRFIRGLIRESKDFELIQNIAKAIHIDLEPVVRHCFLKADSRRKREFPFECLKKLSGGMNVLKMFETSLAIVNQLEIVFNNFPGNDLTIARKFFKKGEITVEQLKKLKRHELDELVTELFCSSKDPCLLKCIQPEVLWRFLIKRNSVSDLKSWAKEYALSVNSELNNSLREFPDWPLTPSMIEEVLLLPENFREDLMNELAKYGIFTQVEMNDVKLLLKRLEKTESLAQIESLLTLPTAVATPDEFHRLYVCYCVQNSSEKGLTDHMKRYSLSSEEVESYVKDADIIQPEWFIEFLKLKRGEEFPENPLFCYNALVVHLQREAKSRAIDLNDLLKEKPMEVVGLYLLEDVCNPSSSVVNERLLDRAIEEIPILRTARSRAATPTLNDCNLYDLLKSATAIDLEKSFTWRVENRYAKVETDSYPYASDPQLGKDYGVRPNLDYIYYLRSGRPTFAFLKFLTDCNKASKKMEGSMISTVCSVAHLTALKNHQHPSLVQSCIAFLDMLGKDTIPLRCSILVLQVSYAYILENCKEKGGKRIQTKKEIDEEFNSYSEKLAKKDLETAKILYSIFEEALDYQLKNNDENDDFANILLEWNILTRFCEFYCVLQSSSLIEGLLKRKQLVRLCLTVQYLDYDKISLIKAVNIHENSTQYYFTQVLRMTEKLILLSESDRKRVKRRLYSDGLNNEVVLDPVLIPSPPLSFFEVLREAEQSEDSAVFLCNQAVRYGNEIFAILASGFEGFTFSCCISSAIQSLLQLEGFSNKNLGIEEMKTLLSTAVHRGYSAWLAELMETLLPEHPLAYLLDWLSFFFEDSFNHDESLVRYKVFHSSLLNMTYDALLNIEPELVSPEWLHSLCSMLVKKFVCSPLLVGQILLRAFEVLEEVDFSSFSEGSDYSKVHRILKIVSENGNISFNLSALIETHSEGYIKETIHLVDSLIAVKHYEGAVDIAKITGQSAERVYFSQIYEGYSNFSGAAVEKRIAYWKRSESQIYMWNLNFNAAAAFFAAQTQNKEAAEAFSLLTIGLRFKNKTGVAGDLENELWKTWLHARKDGDAISLKEVYGLIFKEGPPTRKECELLRNMAPVGMMPENCEDHVQELIDSLLNEEVLRGALKVECNFAIRKNKNLEMIVTAISVLDKSVEIEGAVTTLSQELSVSNSSEIKNEERLLANDLELIISKEATPMTNKYIAFFHQIEEALDSGQVLMSRIRELFCLTLILGKSYMDLIENYEPLSILKEILCKSGFTLMDRLKLATCWIHATKLDNDIVVKTVVEDLKEAILRLYDSDWSAEEDMKRLSFSLLQSMCSHWTSLCNPPSSLGEAMLAEGMKSDSEKETKDDKELAMSIEYCILAHTAFSQSCDIQGIGRVLRRAKVLTNTLTRLAKWSLMVRLLTGIQRYSEMSYVFNILYNHEQFEYLLGKGMDRQPQFKMALIHFLKKNCELNKTELFRLVALNFHLYDEVALLWEEEAIQGLRNLMNKAAGPEILAAKSSPKVSASDLQLFQKTYKSTSSKHLNFDQSSRKSFVVQQDTKKILQSIMESFSHAAEFYIQADMLHKARECTFKAQEIAVQIAVNGDAKPGEAVHRVFGLSAVELTNLAATTDLSCSAMKLLIETNENSVDLSSILWRRYVIDGNGAWLNLALNERHFLASSILEDMIESHEVSTLSIESKERLKKIITMADDVATVYNLATKLQFSEILSKLKGDHESPFVKDVCLNLNRI